MSAVTEKTSVVTGKMNAVTRKTMKTRGEREENLIGGEDLGMVDCDEEKECRDD